MFENTKYNASHIIYILILGDMQVFACMRVRMDVKHISWLGRLERRLKDCVELKPTRPIPDLSATSISTIYYVMKLNEKRL